MVSKLFVNKKGQAVGENSGSGAAFLVLVIMLLIVIYILFLPPSDRDALLNQDQVPGSAPSSSGGYSQYLGTSPLSQAVGHIDYISQATINHDMASFTIFTQTDAHVVATEQSIYIKRSAFETKTKNWTFSIDPSASANLKLAFNVFRPEGILSIYLNGVNIFEGTLQEGSPLPIPLPQHLLKQNNILYFSVSTPGFAFWRVNEYTLQNAMITGDITDSSASFHMQKIYLADSEYSHFETADLSFLPDCTQSEAGNIQITINGNPIYYGIPDCAITNHITLAKSDLQAGENKIEFTSTKGSYGIDMPQVSVNLQDPEYPIYYFNLPNDLFVDTSTNNAFCGKIDGVCPTGCLPDDDKDCCFQESNNNYWCDVETNNPDDRCVTDVLASYAGNCASGYEDVSGNPHSLVAGQCGDDTDAYCPTGCSADYDKDCCYLQVPGGFWCDDIPFTGTNSVCTQIVTPAECGACPNKYHNLTGAEPNCPSSPSTGTPVSGNMELKAGVNIILDTLFADNSYKKVDYVINGNTLPINTYALRYQRNINPFIQEGMNSIVIQPRRDVDIAQLQVHIS